MPVPPGRLKPFAERVGRGRQLGCPQMRSASLRGPESPVCAWLPRVLCNPGKGPHAASLAVGQRDGPCHVFSAPFADLGARGAVPATLVSVQIQTVARVGRGQEHLYQCGWWALASLRVLFSVSGLSLSRRCERSKSGDFRHRRGVQRHRAHRAAQGRRWRWGGRVLGQCVQRKKDD